MMAGGGLSAFGGEPMQADPVQNFQCPGATHCGEACGTLASILSVGRANLLCTTTTA